MYTFRHKLKTPFWQILPKRLTKLSYEKSDNAKNFINMIILAILHQTAVYPLNPGIKFWPCKCVTSANTSLQWLYYEISCSLRIVQKFHISTHFYHFATLVKFNAGFVDEPPTTGRVRFRNSRTTYLCFTNSWTMVQEYVLRFHEHDFCHLTTLKLGIFRNLWTRKRISTNSRWMIFVDEL